MATTLQNIGSSIKTIPFPVPPTSVLYGLSVKPTIKDGPVVRISDFIQVPTYHTAGVESLASEFFIHCFAQSLEQAEDIAGRIITLWDYSTPTNVTPLCMEVTLKSYEVY